MPTATIDQFFMVWNGEENILQMVTIIACAVHIIFTFVVFIYLSVSASLAAVILFPIAIVAYVTFFLGMKLENAKLFIPLLIYLVRITSSTHYPLLH